jgi:hypothetical protein
MSAECNKCGSDLPFEGDCERCQFKAERETASKPTLSALRRGVEAEVERQTKAADHRAEFEGEDYHAVQQHREAADRLQAILGKD